MVKELIELNATEQFLQNANITMTLKEVADKYGKEHGKLVKSFELQVAELTNDRFESFDFWLDTVATQTGKGRTQKLKSYRMSLKTLVWFIAKFDSNLRADVVNFAFEKLEEEKQEAVKQAKLPKIYKDGNMSVRGCIATAWDDSEDAPMEKDIWNALVWKGFVVTKAKATIQRKIPDNLDGFIGSTKGDRGFATFKPHIVREVWEEFEKANKPVKSEYERLHDEFTQISEYYNKKLEEAKNK